ncbi:MAG: NAD-dependent epimerase/dehydratase family protein [Nitrososphaerota archaeon]
MRLAVTGGAGYIGSRLVNRLVEDGHDVIVIDNLSRGSLKPLEPLIKNRVITLNRHDIRDVTALRDDLGGCEAVLHLAAISRVPEAEEDFKTAFEVNVKGTENVLKISAEHGVGKVVYASSAAVYGNLSKPALESDQPNPIGVYGMTKLLAERLLESYSRAYGIKCLALRIFNVYGGDGGSGVVNDYLKSILSGQPIKIYGDGSQVRDFIHIDDVVNAFVKALSYSGPPAFERFNVGTGRPTKILELALKFSRLSQNPPSHITFLDARPGDIRYSVADVGHAKKVLGFEAGVSIEGWISSRLAGGDS